MNMRNAQHEYAQRASIRPKHKAEISQPGAPRHAYLRNAQLTETTPSAPG
ncbi:hypothetical protein A2U01_0087289, partial [Trifolium medium]|nr:hypothetical protein [Trifolium medium]